MWITDKLTGKVKCPVCGASVSKDSNFCQSCGADRRDYPRNTITVCHVPTGDRYEFDYSRNEIIQCSCGKGNTEWGTGKLNVSDGTYRTFCPECGKLLQTLNSKKIIRKAAE